MHRFWIFPLVLGFVGAAHPLVSVAEYLVPASHWVPMPVGIWTNLFWTALGQTLWFASPYGFGIGLLVGLAAAVCELARFGASDRSGGRAATRLFGNLWWLSCYALGVYGATSGIVVALVEVGWIPVRFATYYVTIALLFGVGVINLAAILWATIRTAFADDVLSPRVLRARWSSSNRAIE